MIARAYLNWGRWVCDCPRDFCTYAFQVEPGQAEFRCLAQDGDGCLATAPIEWPADAGQIEAALKRRPVEATRNWFPKDHELAVRMGQPHGQSVADLLAESEIHGVR